MIMPRHDRARQVRLAAEPVAASATITASLHVANGGTSKRAATVRPAQVAPPPAGDRPRPSPD